MAGEMTKERLQINVEGSIPKNIIEDINSLMEERSKNGFLHLSVKFDEKADKEVCNAKDAIVMYYKRRGIEVCYKSTGTSTISMTFEWRSVDVNDPKYVQEVSYAR